MKFRPLSLVLPFVLTCITACPMGPNGEPDPISPDVPDAGPGNNNNNNNNINNTGTFEVETCNLGSILPPDEGTCMHTSGNGTGLLLVGSVLGPNKVWENGGGFLDASGVIQCVGCACLTE